MIACATEFRLSPMVSSIIPPSTTTVLSLSASMVLDIILSNPSKEIERIIYFPLLT